LVFLLIGLGLPDIVEGLKKDGISLYDASIYGVLVTVVLIVVRLLASYGAVIVTKVMSNFITVADPNINLKIPFIIGWSGMRLFPATILFSFLLLLLYFYPFLS